MFWGDVTRIMALHFSALPVQVGHFSEFGTSTICFTNIFIHERMKFKYLIYAEFYSLIDQVFLSNTGIRNVYFL